MNGFLVLGRCSMDDVPLRLCATESEAVEFVNDLNPNDVVLEAADVFGLTVGDVLAVVVVPFRDGGPMPCRHVRDADDWLDQEKGKGGET